MPYSYTNRKGQTYYLHGKEVTLQNGRTQQIYYFTREPKAGAALDAVPAGREVIESPRTGLPFLKGTGTAPAASASTTRPAARGTTTTAGALRASTKR